MDLIRYCPPKSQAESFMFLWVTYYTLLPIVGVVYTALLSDLELDKVKLTFDIKE